VEQEEVRAAVADVLASWRREAGRLGERTSDAASSIAEELGLASRDAVDDLSLRVAQLEHRLKLLERPS
jgi:polyhydroxyalkanoate synthesis regulator phasin